MADHSEVRETEGAGDASPLIGTCTECGRAYALREYRSGDHLPIGTGGACECGSDQFERVDGE